MTNNPESNSNRDAESAFATQPQAGDEPETPMYAVWLALALILAAGIYGVYLGMAARNKPKSNEPAQTSFLNDHARPVGITEREGLT